MRVDVRADIKDATRHLNNVQKRQLPFAISKSLNDTAFQVQGVLKAQLGKDLHQVASFTRSGIQVRKATKSSLEAQVFVEAKRLPYMQYEIKGGVRLPAKSKLIIPVQQRRNQKDLRTKLLSQKNAFESTTRRGIGGIWTVVGKRRLKLLALYANRAQYRPRYKFYEVGEAAAKRIFPITFSQALARALATAH